MNVADDPLKLRKVALVKRAADAERADGAGRAAAETCSIRRDGSYHYPCPFKRRIDPLSPGHGRPVGDILHSSGSTVRWLIQIKLAGD
jgi:hypothetical protein